MVSKKQRSKAVKGKGAAPTMLATGASSKVDAATKKDGSTDSPFLRLPREVRDKIYDELLINRLSPEDQENYEKVLAADRTPCGNFGRENAMDYYEQDICIMPGGNRGYPFVTEAMGLLLANKNTFLIMVEHEQIYPFWRCENPGCYPPDSPCYVMFHLFKEIKHVYIIITNTRSMSDPMLNADSQRINQNLNTVARCFRQGGNKLKTLKVRYTSCFDGQIDTVRDTLEGSVPEGMPERKALLKDRYGRYYHVSRAEAPTRLFKHHKILGPLLNLKSIADYVHIRGDLPGRYMAALKNALSVPESQLGAKAKKKREAEEAAHKKRQQQDSESGLHGFMKKMAEKHKGTDQEKFYLDFLKVPAKSPAVTAKLMKPPTKEEMERYRRESQAAQAAAMAPASSAASSESDYEIEEDDDEDSIVDVVAGGIGIVHGKPVFGPVRPPHLL